MQDHSAAITHHPLGNPMLEALVDPVDREAWLAARRFGLGGSDMAKICGFVPGKGAIDVWLEKTGRPPIEVDVGNARTRGGNLLEPTVAGWFGLGGEYWPRRGGPLVAARVPMLRRRDRPWHLLNLDRALHDPDAAATYLRARGMLEISPESAPELLGGDASTWIAMHLLHRRPESALEIKTHGWFGSLRYSAGLGDSETAFDVKSVALPDDKRTQTTWYQSATELDTFEVAALIDTHHQHGWTLPRDKEAEATLLEIGERFWTYNVLRDIEPEADGSASFGAYLKRQYTLHSDEILPGNPIADELAGFYRRAFNDRKDAEVREESAKQRLQAIIGNHLGIMTCEGPVKWAQRRSGKLRDKDLREHLYTLVGLTDAERADLEARFAAPDYRAIGHKFKP